MLSYIIWTIVILLFIRMAYENKILSTTYYTVESKKLPKNFNGKRIILLSDLHNNEFGKRNQVLLDEIKITRPDIIIIAGDMLVGHSKANNTAALELVRELAKTYCVYYSKGNHEQRLSINPDTCDSSHLNYVKELKKSGVHYLVNQSEEIKDVTITGLDISMDFYQKRHRPSMSQEYLRDVMGKADKNRFNILIAHNPVYFKHYAEWGADLVLSGHVHGGIIHIPGVGGLISPQYVFFPKYHHGKYNEKSSTMILSRGLGSHTIKLRLFNLPELVVIDLKKE